MKNDSAALGGSMDFSKMKDDEIVETIMEIFDEDGRLNMDYIDIESQDGALTLSGRVSSEEELQIIDEIMNENVGAEAYKNKVWVDESLISEDEDDDVNVKGLNFDDDGDLDDQDYSSDEEDEAED
jgi:hypothetical protein